jgi:hypothetical protein
MLDSSIIMLASSSPSTSRASLPRFSCSEVLMANGYFFLRLSQYKDQDVDAFGELRTKDESEHLTNYSIAS